MPTYSRNPSSRRKSSSSRRLHDDSREIPQELLIDRNEPAWDYSVLDTKRHKRRLARRDGETSRYAYPPTGTSEHYSEAYYRDIYEPQHGFNYCAPPSACKAEPAQEQSLFYQTYYSQTAAAPRRRQDVRSADMMPTCVPPREETNSDRPLVYDGPKSRHRKSRSKQREHRRDHKSRVQQSEMEDHRGLPRRHEERAQRKEHDIPVAYIETHPMDHSVRMMKAAIEKSKRKEKEYSRGGSRHYPPSCTPLIRSLTPPKERDASSASASSIVSELTDLQATLDSLRLGCTAPKVQTDQATYSVRQPHKQRDYQDDHYYYARPGRPRHWDSSSLDSVAVKGIASMPSMTLPPRKTVRFAKKLVTSVKYRPKTSPREKSKLFFDDEELDLLEQERCARLYQEQFELVAHGDNEVSVAYPPGVDADISFSSDEHGMVAFDVDE